MEDSIFNFLGSSQNSSIESSADFLFDQDDFIFHARDHPFNMYAETNISYSLRSA